MEATRYRKRPVEVEAMRWDGTADNAVPVVQWIQDNGANCTYECNTEPCSGDDGGHNIIIRTLEGDMMAVAGDFIIKGVQGEFYPCKAAIFEATYEEA